MFTQTVRVHNEIFENINESENILPIKLSITFYHFHHLCTIKFQINYD